ncbi:SelB C-terminal domain-containing protein, partial [Calditrichota bacterium]
IKNGIVAITKADLAEDEWIELVVEEVRELIDKSLLKGASIVVVDSISGKGIEDLRSELDILIEKAEFHVDPGFFRMPVDRSFLIKGYGRVVTGTVWSGELGIDEKIILHPGSKQFRVRGLQAHEKMVDKVRCGDRAALNISGEIDPERGSVLVSPGRLIETQLVDVFLNILPGAREVKHRMRVRLHFGTGEVIGRVVLVNTTVIKPGASGYGRLALETSVAVLHGDRGVIRFYSPVETIGGLKILDPSPPDQNRMARDLEQRLGDLNAGGQIALKTFIHSRGIILTKDLIRIIARDERSIRNDLAEMRDRREILMPDSVNECCIDKTLWESWKTGTLPVLRKFHKDRPEEEGMPKRSWGLDVTEGKAPAELLEVLIEELVSANIIVYNNGLLSLADHVVQLHHSDEKNASRIMELLETSGINVPLPSAIGEELGLRKEEVRRILRALKQIGKVVILDERVVISAVELEKIKQSLTGNFKSGELFTIGQAGELLHSTRKYIVPLFEYLDRQGFSERRDDKRVILG